MFFQPLSFSADIEFDPFHPVYRQWKGQDSANSGGQDSARSSDVEEEELPTWLIPKDAPIFHRVSQSGDRGGG